MHRGRLELKPKDEKWGGSKEIVGWEILNEKTLCVGECWELIKAQKSPLWKHYYFCGDYGRFDSYTDMQHTIGKSDNRRKFNSTNPKWDHWFTSKDKNDPRQIPQVECADELVLVEDTPETLLLEKEQKNRYYQWAKQLKDPIKRELMLRGFDDIPAFAKEVGLSNKKVWNMFKHLKKVAEKELNT